MFRFRLQRVLDLRQQREQEVATQLAEARSAEERARLAAEELLRARDRGAEIATSAQSRQLSAGELQNLRYVVERMTDQANLAAAEADTAREKVNACMVEFTVAFRDRKVLDRLRDREMDDWRAGEVQADRRLMDDIALARFVRKGGASQGGEK
jgi:flagellar FliJ protein